MPAADPSRERLVAGVMSGTSVDGIDVALVRLSGSGRSIRWRVELHHAVPFGDALRKDLLALAEAGPVALDDVARLHVRLAHAYADAVRETLAAAARTTADLDLVGCHGQTVRHLPDPVPVDGEDVTATLQLGSGPVLANRLGVPAVTDFRSADMALGGQGAPLVPYADVVLLGHPEETRVALNIGGIANLTLLPAGTGFEGVVAFDTGPGNMICDALAARHLDARYDRDGRAALTGTPKRALVESLLEAPWFRRPPPKSTGRETYGSAYLSDFERRADERGLGAEDRLATAAALTCGAIAQAMRRWILPEGPVARMLVSGGGVHNRAMMEGLRRALPDVVVESTAAHGLDPDAKEAVAFAVLAHETIDRVPTGMPKVTGARRAAIQGSVSHPS